jgi:hypothetical protein
MIIKDLSTVSVLEGIKRQLDVIENKRTDERHSMLNYYESVVSEMEADIRKYFDSDALRQAPIVTESITSKLINSRAIVYKQAPKRKVDERYFEFVDDLDSAMLQFERMTYLLGTMAMKCRWNEDKQKVDYSHLPEFYPIFLEYDDEPSACIYPLYNYSSNVEKYEQMFAYWSNEQHYLINGKGQIVDQEDNPDRINPYGVKPVVYAHRKVLTTDWFREGCSDIVSMNRAINIMLTEMSLAMRLQMLGQPVLKGVDEASRIKLGVDKPIVVPEGADFDFKAPGGQLQQYVEAMRFLVDSVAYNHNLKTKWSVGREGSVSGESLKMAEIELTESVMLDAQMIWRPIENKRFNIDKAIIEYETGASISEDCSVDFSEPRFPLTAQEERNQWDWEWKNGLSSKKDWYRRNNPDADDSQLDEIIEGIEAEGSPESQESIQNRATRFDLRQALDQ